MAQRAIPLRRVTLRLRSKPDGDSPDVEQRRLGMAAARQALHRELLDHVTAEVK